LLKSLFDYDYWANQQALASLSSVPGGCRPGEGALKTFAHVIGAQQVWLARFNSSDPSAVQPWPTMTADECRTAMDQFHSRWMALIESFTPEKLASNLTYRNTKGVEFRTPIEGVLMHLIVHSAYHRGQVAAAVRQAGGQPAPTDYVVYLRKKSEAA
jgi:uncharacterized damage-inducible protein DinB